MSYDGDVIVVGSGPSGVSVAWPLLEAGLRVVLLDGGRERDVTLPHGAYHDLRRGTSDQWRTFLGPRLEALRPAGPPSPKFDAPAARFAFETDSSPLGIDGDGFAAVVSLARGGLANIWGAGIAAWGAEELAEFPFAPDSLAGSYRRVAARIGVTGFERDDLDSGHDGEIPSLAPMPLAENARRLFARYAERRSELHALGVRFGRPRTAVLTEPREGRGACTRCDMCVWGCGEEAIYSAAHELPALSAHPGCDYRPGTVVEAVEPAPGGWSVVLREGSPSLTAPRLVLAAGALVSTRLVLALQGRFDEPVPVVGAPGAGFALFLPGRLGAPVATREFSMGQLSFLAAGAPGVAADGAYGTLFPASGLPASLVVERMPLTRPAAVRLFRLIQPALLFGNCFLPGRYSASTARLVRDRDGRPRLVVRGGVAEVLAPRLVRLEHQLARAFRRLGAWILPGSFSPIGPGEDVRYAGTLPMRASPRRGEVDPAGELHGAAGLHVVDLSIFPAMSAKHHTLTMMANADRIGRLIAERWGRS